MVLQCYGVFICFTVYCSS